MSQGDTPSDDSANQKSKTSGGNIGNRLKKLYEDVASEPVPDEFLKLLEDADDANSSENDE